MLDAKRPRAMIFGSFQPPGTPCGITAAVETCLKSPLADVYQLEIHSTRRDHVERSSFQRIAFGISLFARTLRDFLAADVQVADIHAVSDRDFLKHAAVVFAALVARKRCILRIHGGDFDRVYARSGPVARFITRLTLRQPHRVVLLSESWAQVIREIEPNARTAVVPNAIDAAEYSRFAKARPKKSQRVALLGNLCERKGHFDALEAAATLHESFADFELCFAGVERDVGAEAALRARTRELGLESVVRFLGPVFGEDRERLFTSAAVFILPSHTENMPLSLMEAMAAGLPVIATRVGAVCEMITDGHNGVLIAPQDPNALASAIRDLLDDPEKGARLGCQALADARNRWDKAVIAESNLTLYRDAEPTA